MKPYKLLLSMAAVVAAVSCSTGDDIESRIDKLLSQMTLDEKIGQMNMLTQGEQEWMDEQIHSAHRLARRNPRIPHHIPDSARAGRDVRPRTGRTRRTHRRDRGSGMRHPLDILADARRGARPALGTNRREFR